MFLQKKKKYLFLFIKPQTQNHNAMQHCTSLELVAQIHYKDEQTENGSSLLYYMVYKVVKENIQSRLIH